MSPAWRSAVKEGREDRRGEGGCAGGTLAVAMTEHLTVESFRPQLHEEFRLESHTVELIEVTEIPRAPGGRAPFSLVFQGGPVPPLPQRIYRVEHPELGAIDIFLVPIGPDRYEAVFT